MNPPLVSNTALATIPDSDAQAAAGRPAEGQHRIDGIDRVICALTIGAVLAACYFALTNSMFHPLFLRVVHADSSADRARSAKTGR